MDDIVTVLSETARGIAQAEGIAVVIRQDGNCFYAAEDSIEKLWAGKIFHADACVSCWAMKHRAVVAINDVRLDECIPKAAYHLTFVRSLVIVPIGTGRLGQGMQITTKPFRMDDLASKSRTMVEEA